MSASSAFGWLEQTGRDLPLDDQWLSCAEAAKLATFRVPKRRADWRLGRWTAKTAVAAYLNFPLAAALAQIEIRPAPSGAPEVFLAGHPAALAISLTHCDGVAATAVGPAGAVLGCDIEAVAPRSEAFVADYFTVEEQQSVLQAGEGARHWTVAVLWSAKESALKALREGLRRDTRSVRVRLDPSSGEDWSALRVDCESGPSFSGWWRVAHGMVRTAICPSPPVTLCRQPGAEIPSL